jgi:predicted transcriptional regulator YdeE
MPKIEMKSHPKMMVVGVKYRGKNEQGEVPQLWGTLMARQDEIIGRDDSIHAAYGLSIMDADYEDTMVFDYIAGYPVVDGKAPLPDGMAQFTIPEGKYAVITCPSLEWISQAYDAIYRWVRESEDISLDLSSGNFNFELYGEEFMPDEGSTIFYIYVPVKPKG